MKRFIFPFLFLLTLIPIYGKAQQNCSLSVQGTVEEVSCSGGMDGAIRLQVRGGTKPYTYYWNSGQETASIGKLTAGTYRVRVQDKDGCITKAEFSLTAQEKDLGLKVLQQAANSGKKSLLVLFPGNTKPYTMYIKKLSDKFYGPPVAYTGQTLEKGIYLLEAFTASGCSVFEQVIIEAN